LDRAEKSIFDIAERRIRQGFVGIREIVKESFRTIDQLSQSKDLVTGLATGFVDLDEMTSGLQKGDLIIVAARPAMGKTSFCLNIAQNASQRTGETVGIFSLEMSKQQLVLRMLCADARVDAHKLRTGNLGEKDWARLAKAYADLSASKIFIDDSATLTPLEMRAKCRRLKAEHGLALVVVDYLQLVSGGGRVENRQQEISAISRSLKGLAKDLDCPVMALSQLSRAPEARSDRRPQLSDLRESGAIEQDADIVMFIYREEEHKPTDENRGIAEIIIGKQRNGPTGSLRLAFIKEFTRFENLEWRAP
ncbi:MAG: replicative DNA helicase, partial [Vicinamibacteria bacterium]